MKGSFMDILYLLVTNYIYFQLSSRVQYITKNNWLNLSFTAYYRFNR